jgi:6-pyruvoyl-tetrahydropterin synthase
MLFLLFYHDSINKLNEAIKMINTYAVMKTSDVKELDAQQVVIGIARTDGKKGKSGFCAVVDAFGINDLQSAVINETGRAWMIEAINDLRSRIASDLNKNGKPLNVLNLGFDAVIKAMDCELQSQRMTKEAIAAWFTAELSPLVTAAISAKMINISANKLAKYAEQYSDKFQSLAGRNVSMSEKEKEQLQKAMALLPDDYSHVIAEKIAEKLNSVSEAGNMLDAL